jgi:hypothetical protein
VDASSANRPLEHKSGWGKALSIESRKRPSKGRLGIGEYQYRRFLHAFPHTAQSRREANRSLIDRMPCCSLLSLSSTVMPQIRGDIINESILWRFDSTSSPFLCFNRCPYSLKLATPIYSTIYSISNSKKHFHDPLSIP